jgi:hypothetical protein
MWVIASRSAVLSIITGGGKWIELTIHADPLYQHLLITAEKKFWRCVQNGEKPRLFGIEPPRPRLEVVRKVSDEFTVPLCRTHHRGDELTWWEQLNVDPMPMARRLWQNTRSNGSVPQQA